MFVLSVSCPIIYVGKKKMNKWLREKENTSKNKKWFTFGKLFVIK